MKILSIAIPVYNTEKYIRRCLDSLIVNDIIESIEIIAVNDGSTDNSIGILNEYREAFPQSIIIVDQENGGHGSTINVALKIATGKYFRVLDSDDWFDTINFIKYVKKLENENADLIVTNYRKEHIYSNVSESIVWKHLKDDTVYYFDQINLDILDKEYFVMANSTYKTEILRKSKLELFEKTFYVDMQYNVIPILQVNTFKYMNLDIYRYFIGRPDQSMNLQNFVKNRYNHEKVMKFLLEYYETNKSIYSDNKRQYVEQILFYMLTTHYYIYCVYSKNDRKTMYREIKKFDSYLKKLDPQLYSRMENIGQIKYNRKTSFIFVKINAQIFSKLLTTFGKIIKGGK